MGTADWGGGGDEAYHQSMWLSICKRALPKDPRNHFSFVPFTRPRS